MSNRTGPLLTTLALVGLWISAAHAQWQRDGAPICTNDAQKHFSSQCVIQNAGGIIFVWEDNRLGPHHVYAQRLDAAGVPQWSIGGVLISSSAYSQLAPVIVPDQRGGAFVTYPEFRSVTEWDIVMQHLDPAGVPLWGGGVTICDAAGNQLSPAMVSDYRVSVTSDPGAIVTWADSRSEADIYLQAVVATGAIRFAPNGMAICTAQGIQSGPTIVSDGVRNQPGFFGAIVAWEDRRNGLDYDVYAQRVGASGSTQWTGDGVPVATATGYQLGPRAVSMGSGLALVSWSDGRNGPSDIYAQKVGPTGFWLTDGLPVTRAVGDQAHQVMIADGVGGVILAWEDWHQGFPTLKTQRLDSSGAPLWALDGIAVAAGPGAQGNPLLVPGPAEGAIVVWADGRDPSSGTDIYAQAIDGPGNGLWMPGGIPLCRAVNDQVSPAGVPDGAGGAIVVWEDRRRVQLQETAGPQAPTDAFNMDIYANRVTNTGGVVAVDPVAARSIRLRPPYPNPTSRGARLSIELPSPTHVSARVVGVEGRLVRTLASGDEFPAGRHVLDWDGADHLGHAVPTGVYFLVTRAGDVTGASRVLVLR